MATEVKASRYECAWFSFLNRQQDSCMIAVCFNSETRNNDMTRRMLSSDEGNKKIPVRNLLLTSSHALRF